MTENKITSRQSKQKEALILQFKKTPIIQVACEKTGIGRATYYRWRKEDEDFRNQSDEALLSGVQLVNDMAESKLITAIRDQNMTAIIFWLKNRHDAYHNRMEVSGKLESSTQPLTQEQEALIQKALKMSSLSGTDIPNADQHE